jgi:hypothetical protein
VSQDDRPFNWARFLVHFFFGGLFGGIFGLYMAQYVSERSYAILTVVVSALLVGLVAGFWGDRFWESFRDGSWLNPFRWF